MRIALLNLPYDNNYGGNLQRYALMIFLQEMGHQVVHLNLRFRWSAPLYKLPFRVLRKASIKMLSGKTVMLNPERDRQKRYEKLCRITDSFYQEYIQHTPVITTKKQLSKYTDYDAFVVGSDQVWRKRIASDYMPLFFFEHLLDVKKPKIAYAASFGTDSNELSKEEVSIFGALYSQFTAVSVREKSALNLLEQYHWSHPKGIHLLDPTFLLSKEQYQELIKNSDTKDAKGKLFCYILDSTDEKTEIINNEATKRGLKPYIVSLNDTVSIPQWLRCFNDAEFVITDSFHGLVFSIIFNKQFILLRNPLRGNARFDSILETFNISNDSSQGVDWGAVNAIIDTYREKSRSFLVSSLQ